MYTKKTRGPLPGRTASVVDNSHRIRRRIRDLRESELRKTGYACVQEDATPRFLLFRRLRLPRRASMDTGAEGQLWFVLGTWLLLAAFVGALVFAALHVKG